jgi:hypothetical protein
MLNLSPHNPCPEPRGPASQAFRTIGQAKREQSSSPSGSSPSARCALGLFLPWTQNIRARGTVTSLSPDQRPQTIHAIIPGRLEEWFVRKASSCRKAIPSCA